MIPVHIIGVGDDGMQSLSLGAREALEKADVVIGSRRLFDRLPGLAAETIAWPRPISAMTDLIRAHEGRRIAVIATGDPLWYSAGSLIAGAFPPERLRFHPQLSSYQLAASRMQWALQEVACETIHGRPVERISPLLGDGQRLLLLGRDRESPREVAAFLRESGFGASAITVLSHLGGAEESLIDGRADDWDRPVADFHVLAVTCRAAAALQPCGRTPGLANGQYVHDGQITKREIRAVTLAMLRPMPGELLWDIGCGAGSVAIEWVRGASGARAVAIDRDAERLVLARDNARRLGGTEIEWIEGEAAGILACREDPNAVFFGGALDQGLVERVWARLGPHGRIVGNAVTQEAEIVLAACHRQLGGELRRIAIQTLDAVGRRHAWRPSMPVTQWSCGK